MLAGYLRVIRSPHYRPIWLGQLVSSLGDTINYIALVVLIYRLTGSGLALSTLVLFQIVPVLLAGPIAGPAIDRLPRKSVLIAADLVRCLLALGLILAAAPWQVYSLAFGMALAAAFFSPALAASLPSLVSEGDLLAANSVAWSTGQLVQIIGSALAGGLIALVGVRAAFGFNAASFLISAGSIALVPFPVVTRTSGRYWRSLREGVSYVRRDPFISRMVVVQALASLGVGGTSALLVVLAERRYGLPAAGFAGFLLAIGLGALLGPFLLARRVRDYRDRRLLFLPYIIRGGGDILLGLATLPLLGEAILFVYGLNTSSGMVVYQSVMQSEVPDTVRGRVFTVMDVTWNAARMLSVLLAGLIADRAGIVAVYVLGGLTLIGAGVLGLAGVPLGQRHRSG